MVPVPRPPAVTIRPAGSCTSDTECGAGECGPELFDFSGRSLDHVGPVVVDSAVTPGASAENPVPIEGLIESPDLFAFVASEAIEGAQLNYDATPPTRCFGSAIVRHGDVLPIGGRA